jgi:hypothetical protein
MVTGVMAVIAFGALGAACSSGPKTPGVAGSGTAPSTTAAASAGQTTINQASFMTKLLAYTDCMRSHGIADFPDPTAGPGGQGGGFSISAGPGSNLDPNNPQFEAASRACHVLLPYGGTLPPPTAKELAEYTKFAACIRQHGFPNFPDPNSQGVFVLNKFDLSSAGFHGAQNTCRSAAGVTGPMRVDATNSGPEAPAPH